EPAKVRLMRLHEIERDVAALREADGNRGVARRTLLARNTDSTVHDDALLAHVAAPRPRAARIRTDRLGAHEHADFARAGTHPGATLLRESVRAMKIDDRHVMR